MRYETMNKSHLPQVVNMYVETFNAPPWNDKWTVETVTKRLTQMINCEGFYGLVCFKDNMLCGMILGDLDIYYDCMQLYIKEFCVSQNLRGTGIGTDLLKEFECRLLERGITKVYLLTSRTDETEAFYNKRSYNSWNSMVMMGKTLQE